MSINNATICGNITRDAQGRKIAGGYVINFTVAVNEPYKDGDEWKTKAAFIPCVMFGGRAEKLEQYLKKGIKVCVSGSLKYSEWTKDDEKRSRVEILVRDLEFMTRKEDSNSEYIPFD